MVCRMTRSKVKVTSENLHSTGVDQSPTGLIFVDQSFSSQNALHFSFNTNSVIFQTSHQLACFVLVFQLNQLLNRHSKTPQQLMMTEFMHWIRRTSSIATCTIHHRRCRCLLLAAGLMQWAYVCCFWHDARCYGQLHSVATASRHISISERVAFVTSLFHLTAAAKYIQSSKMNI